MKRKTAYKDNRNAQKYDWDEWMAPGYTLTLTKGKHYFCQTHGMASQIRNQASKRGLSVTLVIDKDTIEFTVWR